MINLRAVSGSEMGSALHLAPIYVLMMVGFFEKINDKHFEVFPFLLKPQNQRTFLCSNFKFSILVWII